MRCQAVLMAARGRPHRHMAEDLAVSVRTLQRWLHRFHQRGLGGLVIRWASGRAAKIPASLAPEIPHSIGFSGRGYYRSSKASRCEDL
jgi:transposase